MKYGFIRIILLFLFFTLILGCRKKNRPPYTLYTPSGPTLGLVGFTYEFSSLAIDPDGDSLAIRFDIGNGDTSAWSQLVATEDSVKILLFWSEPGTYYVKAQAKDYYENISKWSLPLYILISINQPPNPPSIPSGPSIGYTDTFYLFSSSAINPDEDSVSIRFEWGDGDTSEWSYPVLNRFPVMRAYSWSYPDTYYIKAQARGMLGETSEWSEEHQIIIFSKSALSIDKIALSR